MIHAEVRFNKDFYIKLLDRCDQLEFEYLDNTDEGLIGTVREKETTPYYTGLTQGSNTLTQLSDAVIFQNTCEYSQYLYNSGRAFKTTYNKNANDHWVDIGNDGYVTLAEDVAEHIAEELRKDW